MDYSAFVTTVRLQLLENGRSVKLLKLSSAVESGEQPWENNASERTEVDSITVNALNIPLSSASSFGFKINFSDFKSSIDALFLCEIDADNKIEEDLFEILRDGVSDYRITFKEIFKPGDTAIMAYLGVSQ